MIDPKTLEIVSPFKDVFPINPAIRAAIETSMRDVGYDDAHPIIVWAERNCVLDGHTRHSVAVQLGLEVAASYKSFETEDEALEYAINCQKNRRNLTDADIWRYLKALDKRKPIGANQHTKEGVTPVAPSQGTVRTSIKTAEIIGTSRGKIEKARTVFDRGTPEIKQKLDEGDKGFSLNRAYRETIAEEDKKKRLKPTRPDQLKDLFDPPQSKAIPTTEDQTPEESEPEACNGQHAFSGMGVAILGESAREDIVLFEKLKSTIDELQRVSIKVMGQRSPAWMTPYHARVHALISIPDPTTWIRCKKCKGEKITHGKGTCTRCQGYGYYIPRLER